MTMPEPLPDPAALARVVRPDQLGPALSGGLTVQYMDLPGREGAPELEGAEALKAPGRPVAGAEWIIPGVPSRLRAAPPPDGGDEPDRGHIRNGFKSARLLHTVAGPTSDWWD